MRQGHGGQRRVEAAGDGAGLAEALTRRIKQALGVTVQVKVGAPGSVPRSEGKAVRVIDHRPKG